MFFYIGDNCPLTALKQVEPRLFLDDGWNHKSGIWYKGYSTECVLEDSIYDIVNGYQPAGKYCVICAGVVYHPVLRGFPLFGSEENITNIKLENFEIIKYDNPSYSDDESITIEEASRLIGNVLVENTENFYKFNDAEEMTVVFSAGLDTGTVWAVQETYNKSFKLSVHVPDPTRDRTFQDFLGIEREYKSDLIDKVTQDYWGYQPSSYYNKLNWSSTGYYAEVYMYRDAIALNAIARYFGKTIDTLADETDYLYWFLKRPNVVDNFKDKTHEFKDESELKSFLWSTIWYDHQMWHLDNNMMFCPFADIRIPKIMSKLSISDIAYNSITGIIQKNIISRFKPEIVSLISDYKNEKDIWKNFRANFDESIIDPKTKLIYR